MMESRRSWSRSVQVALLGAVAVLLAVPAAYAAPKVLVDASYQGTPGFGQRVRGVVSIDIRDGSTLRSVTWTQIAGAPARLIPLANHAVRVRLATEDVYRSELIHVLSEPPVPLAPPNLPETDPEFEGGLQDRWQVVALNPLALEEAGKVTLKVSVLTTSGVYTDTVDVSVGLPFGVTTGLHNVPINQRVLLYGKEQGSYSWSFASKPFASDAVLRAANTRMPYFVPDAPGVYEVKVTDIGAAAPVMLTIYAGTWRGVIKGQDSDGNPIADSTCTNCHNGAIAPDKFTSWAASGHAHIFSDNLNTSDHYGTSCFSCHTVGYDPKTANNGIDEASDWSAFLASDLLHGASPNNWATMLHQFPNSAQKANIQCENCHGPQVVANDTSPAHGLSGEAVGDPRISLSAELCGSCHGEPTRHARYQQWQISGHGNYVLANEEGMSGSCAKCHTVNGFLEWVPVLLGQVPGKKPSDNVAVTWTQDQIHPQTCVTCHDPHDVGTTTDVTTDAKMRITGQTAMLEAGFQANGVGSGAICITCHNSRRGLRNDSTFNPSDAARAPHRGPQSDILFGQNAYFVTAGVRGRHSFIEDTCVTCHMEKSKPPAALSNNLGGTNHTFNASKAVCAECHQSIDIDNLQTGFEVMMEDLQSAIQAKFVAVMAQQIAAGNTINLGGTMLTNASNILSLTLSESHGNQAVTVDLKGGKHLEAVPITSITVVRPAPLEPQAFYEASGYDLAKAFWNLEMLENDGSKGAHNPTWVLDVLNESLSHVGATTSRRLTKLDLTVSTK